MNIKHFKIDQEASIKETLKKIEKNKNKIVFLVDRNDQVTGSVTDGDIRRILMGMGTLNDPIHLCGNPNFAKVNTGFSREQILKLFDKRIDVVPVLSESNKLLEVVTKENIPASSEDIISARARAPVRISFGGGGSDITSFFQETPGAVISTAISLYCHCTLTPRYDKKIHIASRDLNEVIDAQDLESLLKTKSSLGLVQAVISLIQPKFGFDLVIHSDFPAQSGLGGSAAVAAGILGCFNQYRLDKWSKYELAELAYQAERHSLGVSGGWQDQYASIFGGFNFMEFTNLSNTINPIKLDHNTLLELEESLVLCDTGISHKSGVIHDAQIKQMAPEDIHTFVSESVSISHRMRDHLLRGNLNALGELLNDGWSIKRKYNEKVSDPYFDSIYEGAKLHGALGGKLLGAGGGGFFLFFVPPHRKLKLLEYIEMQGLKAKAFYFERDGLQSWAVRK